MRSATSGQPVTYSTWADVRLFGDDLYSETPKNRQDQIRPFVADGTVVNDPRRAVVQIAAGSFEQLVPFFADESRSSAMAMDGPSSQFPDCVVGGS